jgi:hypothetical protein
VRATISFVAISPCSAITRRMSLAGSASSSLSESVSTLAERVPPSSIASSPKMSPVASVASAIARPSGCSRVTRRSPLRTM